MPFSSDDFFRSQFRVTILFKKKKEKKKRKILHCMSFIFLSHFRGLFFFFNTGQRQFCFISFPIVLWHVPSTCEINLTAIEQNQPALDLIDLISDNYSCCEFSQLPLPVLEVTILCDIATGIPRPLYPNNINILCLTFCTHYHIQVSLFRQYLLRPVSLGLTCIMLLLIGPVLALNVSVLKICNNLYRSFLTLA